MDKKKMKLCKKIVIILLVIIIIFIIITLRKIIIISSLQNKISKYIDSTNYYAKLYSYQGYSYTITECYVKDEGYVLYFTNTSQNGEVRKLINYYDGTKVNTYIETEENKVAILDSNGLPSKIMVADYTYTNNFGELLMMSLMTSIRNIECNGKNCYYLTGVFSNILMGEGENSVYVEKETGLPVRANNGKMTNSEGETYNIIVDYNYEFDMVTNEYIKEPDISQYSIAENS